MTTNHLTTPTVASVTQLTGATGVGTNPLAELAQWGTKSPRGVQETVAFQQTLASALADVLSRISLSGGNDDEDGQSSSNSIVPDFTKTMIPLQLSLAMNSYSNQKRSS